MRPAPRRRGVEQVTAAACGATVTAAQLLAGASGPLPDASCPGTDVDRRTIAATRAFTQTGGHLLKIGYCVWVSRRPTAELPECLPALWLIAGGMVHAIAGARIGARLFDWFDDRQSRRITGPVILALGAICAARDVRDWLTTHQKFVTLGHGQVQASHAVGGLYKAMANRGELRGDRVSDVGGLLEALGERFGAPAAVVCDRWREGELRQSLEAVGFPPAALVVRGTGYHRRLPQQRRSLGTCAVAPTTSSGPRVITIRVKGYGRLPGTCAGYAPASSVAWSGGWTGQCACEHSVSTFRRTPAGFGARSGCGREGPGPKPLNFFLFRRSLDSSLTRTPRPLPAGRGRPPLGRARPEPSGRMEAGWWEL